MEIPSKVCKKCGVPKPLTEYYRHYSMRDKHFGTCKVCYNAACIKRYHDKMGMKRRVKAIIDRPAMERRGTTPDDPWEPEWNRGGYTWLRLQHWSPEKIARVLG